MLILVSDTSILIDLEKGGLLETVFAIGLTFVVPDYLYDTELAEYNGPYLRQLGLGVLELTPEENELVQSVLADSKGLSAADCSALICAMRENHSLMTGDSLLRKEAEARKTNVRGLLWLLDHMEASGTSLTLLYEALNKIHIHPKCRLPKDEVKLRLKKWSE